MARIVVLGAGELGGAVARQLAARGVADGVAIIDDAADVAAGKALDIAQAAPVDGHTISVTGGADISAAIGAAVIVVAEPHGTGPQEQHEDACLELLARVAAMNATAPIVCAGADHARVVARAVAELGIASTRVFGTAPEGLRAALAGLTALEAGAVPGDVSVSIFGMPPADVIVGWEEGAIAGRPLRAVLTPPAIRRLDARAARLWPPGPMTLAGAATRAIGAALGRMPHAITLFAVAGRHDGGTGGALMLPATLHPAGILAMLAPALSTRDRVRLDSVLQR